MHQNGRTTGRSAATLAIQEAPVLNGGTILSNGGAPVSNGGTTLLNEKTMLSNGGTTLSNAGTTLSTHKAVLSDEETVMPGDETPVSGGETSVPGSATRSRGQAAIRRSLGGYKANASHAKRLLAANVAFEVVARDDAVRAALAAHGYDAARLAAGQALLAEAQAQMRRRDAAQHTNLAARRADIAATTHAHAAYLRHIQLARVALRDTPTLAVLELTGPRRRNLAGWLGHAQQLYAAALGDTSITAALAAYGLGWAELEAAQASIRALAGSRAARQVAQTQAKAATASRHQALTALDRWMRDFLAVARVALAER